MGFVYGAENMGALDMARRLMIDNLRSLKLRAEQEAMIFHENARLLFNLAG